MFEIASSQGEKAIADRQPTFRLGLLFSMMLSAMPGLAAVSFDPAFLSDDPQRAADLSHFEQGAEVLPGSYRVDIYLNGSYIATQDVAFKRQAQAGQEPALQPCLSADFLESIGVNLALFSPQPCVAIGSLADAAAVFDVEKLRLDLSVPQAALKQSARGYIAPEYWDNGINSAQLNYNFTGANMHSETSNNDNYFLSLQNGVNLGAWRLRNYSSWNYNNNNAGGRWDSLSTYAERPIPALGAALLAGDSYTSGLLFSSVGFRGVQLAADDNMLPDSQKGFAPIIRGVAKSHAQVTIKQNGYMIYQTYVSPGAFVIEDLFPTSSSGDLYVTVTEADGSSQEFSVPFSSVPNLQREGQVKYDFTLGEVHNGFHSAKPHFLQGTLFAGLPGGITLYGGSQISENYHAAALGAGRNMGRLGALSLDMIYAGSKLYNGMERYGSSIRFLYAKTLNDLGTNFQLLGYRYSSEGFYTLEETAYRPQPQSADNERAPANSLANLDYARRGRVQVNLSQQLGALGSLYLMGSHQSYWHTRRADYLFQAGFNTMIRDLTLSLTFNYNQGLWSQGGDRSVALGLSMPLGTPWGKQGSGLGRNNQAYISYNSSSDLRGGMQHSAGLNGSLLKGGNLNYSVQQSLANQGRSESGGVDLGYQGAYGNASVGYRHGQGTQQVTYGMSGGVVIHGNGVTLSQPLGETNVLIQAPGARDIAIENGTGVKTDWRGYAVVPYATAYRENRIALDINSLAEDMELDENVANVIPTKGAVVRATFKTRAGIRALVTLHHQGKVVPFGAIVSNPDSQGAGIVGDNGQVYLSGLSPQGLLQVKWGNEALQQCQARYLLPPDKTAAIALAVAECVS